MCRIYAAVVTAIALLLSGCHFFIRDSVLADLDGDGISERIEMRTLGKELQIKVNVGSLKKESQVLSFGIDPSRQDAVCSLPVELTTTPSDCTPDAFGTDSEPLEGCKASARSQDVMLSDDNCDPIVLYWNHDTRKVWWWRL